MNLKEELFKNLSKPFIDLGFVRSQEYLQHKSEQGLIRFNIRVLSTNRIDESSLGIWFYYHKIFDGLSNIFKRHNIPFEKEENFHLFFNHKPYQDYSTQPRVESVSQLNGLLPKYFSFIEELCIPKFHSLKDLECLADELANGVDLSRNLYEFPITKLYLLKLYHREIYKDAKSKQIEQIEQFIKEYPENEKLVSYLKMINDLETIVLS